MAQNVTIAGASYSSVPSIEVPKTGGGTAVFSDTSPTTAVDSDVVSGKIYFKADGTQSTGNIATKTGTDLSASGDTVTVPAGYYASQTTKAVASGTAGTPTATKGTVSNHSVTVTPSVTNTSGYITGSTKTGTAVTVTASELESGTLEITQNGTGIDVTGYASVDVAVSGGGGTSWDTRFDGTVSVTSPEGNYYFGTSSGFYEDILENSVWRVTWNGNSYVCTATYTDSDIDNYALGDPGIMGGTPSGNNEPFLIARMWSSVLVVFASQSGTYSIKLEKQVSGGGSVIISDTTDPAGGTIRTITAATVNLQQKTNITPTTSSQTIEPDSGYNGLSSVQINAMPSGTAGTPTATKGTVSNHQVSITPSVTNTTGYITGSTKTGTAVTVSASELVSGSETKTANGTYNVTNLAELVVNVSGGSGLEYETGTYTPTANTAQPTISFANSHSRPPVFVCISDTSSASGISSSSNTSWSIIDYNYINGAGFPYSTSASRYGLVTYSYRGSNSTTVSSVQIQHTSDETGTTDNTYYRYWATASNFKPGSTSTSRYWRNGRTYKWIAVWK